MIPASGWAIAYRGLLGDSYFGIGWFGGWRGGDGKKPPPPYFGGYIHAFFRTRSEARAELPKAKELLKDARVVKVRCVFQELK